MWITEQVWPAWVRVSALNTALGEKVIPFSLTHIRNSEPLGHQNYTAGVALLMIPWFVALAVTATSLRSRQWWWSMSVLGVVLLCSTFSRGGTMGLLATVLLLPVPLWRRGLISRGRMFLIFAGVVLFSTLIISSNERFRSMAADLVSGGAGLRGDLVRRAMVEAGLKIGSDHWWSGIGMGTVSLVYPRYRHELVGGFDNAYQLHSTPAQIWAEWGLPGLLGTVWLSGALVLMVLRLHKAEAWLKNSRLQAYTYAVAFGFVGYAVLALTDYQLDVTAIWVALAVGIALLATITHLVQSGDGNSADMRRSKWLLAAPALLVLLSALVYLPPVLLARVTFYDGVTELYERNIPAFLANATRATELTPWEAHYANQVAIELGNAALATQDAEPHGYAAVQSSGSRVLWL
jgi:O-antigen ligase